jgi:hypothetical protein
MRSNEKNVLVARSRCYLALGDHRAAMEDVEAALREDKDFFKVTPCLRYKRLKYRLGKISKS